MRYRKYYCIRRHHSPKHGENIEWNIYKAGVLTCPAEKSLQIPQIPPPLKWCSDIYPCFLSGSVQFFLITLLYFLTLFFFFSLTRVMVGHFLALLLYWCCLQFELDPIWPGNSRHCTCAGEGHCWACAAWGRGAASSVCTRMIDTSQTLPLALIGCVDLGAVDSCKSNYSHWVEPQTVDFYTADLYLILLSYHDDNFSKYKKK